MKENISLEVKLTDLSAWLGAKHEYCLEVSKKVNKISYDMAEKLHKSFLEILLNNSDLSDFTKKVVKDTGANAAYVTELHCGSALVFVRYSKTDVEYLVTYISNDTPIATDKEFAAQYAEGIYNSLENFKINREQFIDVSKLKKAVDTMYDKVSFLKSNYQISNLLVGLRETSMSDWKKTIL